MNSFFAILIIVGLTSSLIMIFKKSFEEVVPCSFFIIILIIYFFGLFGNLKNGISIILILASCSSLVFLLFSIIKRTSTYLRLLFTPGFLIFMLLVVITHIGTRGLLMIRNDEFSHWGLVVKNMVIFDKFGDFNGSTTMFPSYPPGLSILQYFFIRIRTGFHESSMYMALDALAISTFMPIFHFISRKKFYVYALITLIIFSSPMVFYPDFYHLLYVDATLGVIFAYLLFSYFSKETLSIFNIINISLASAVIILIKDSGIIFALIVNLIIYIDFLFIQKRFQQNRSQLKIIFSCAIITTISIVFTKLSWNIFLRLTDTPHDWNFLAINFSEIIGLITSKTNDSQKAAFQLITSMFFDFQGNHAIKMSSLTWIGFFILLWILISRIEKKETVKRRIKLLFSILLCGFILYTGLIFILYCIIFPETEGTTGASFFRYLNSYLLGWFIFSVTFLLTRVEQIYPKNFFLILVTCFSISTLFVPYYEVARFLPILASAEAKSTKDMRLECSDSIHFPDFMDPQKDKVFIINIPSKADFQLIDQFNATPIQTQNFFKRDLIEINKETGEVTHFITPKDFAEILMSEYSYVYIHKIDEEYIPYYERLFMDPDSIQSYSLYRVVKTKDEILLEHLENWR